MGFSTRCVPSHHSASVHGMGTEAPKSQNVPVWHLSQLSDPGLSATLPLGHAAQADARDAFVTLLTVPGAHGMHAELSGAPSAPLYVPAMHATHALATEFRLVSSPTPCMPLGQALQPD